MFISIPQRQLGFASNPGRASDSATGVVKFGQATVTKGIGRIREESGDQSRFGWAFGRFGDGAEGGTKTRIAAEANEA